MSVFDESELDDFIVESEELLDSAEQASLRLDKGSSIKTEFSGIYRLFHSIKGAAAMIGLDHLNQFMHQLENILKDKKDQTFTSKELSSFLKYLDEARLILKVANDIPLPVSPSAVDNSHPLLTK